MNMNAIMNEINKRKQVRIVKCFISEIKYMPTKCNEYLLSRIFSDNTHEKNEKVKIPYS